MLLCQQGTSQGLIRRQRGSWYLELILGSIPTGYMLCLPLWVLIAERRMRLTDLKGNYWRESLSMPLTDNQLIIVLIIYSSPPRLLSILLAVSLKQSTETFNGLAGSRLWWGRVKTTMLALASLHFYTVQVPTPLINPPREEKKLRKNNNSDNNICNPRREQCPSTPTWLTVHEIELIGVIDQKAPAPERTGWRGRGEGWLVCYLIEWKILGQLLWCTALYRKERFNGSCQTSSTSALVVKALRSAVLYIKALAMTGPDGQMFASCFNCTVKRNIDISLYLWL